MILIKITHHLNLLGLRYFPSWFLDLYEIMKNIDGFIDIAYRLEIDHLSAKIILFFENEEKLNQWARSDLHKIQMEKLDPYRTHSWEATRTILQTI